MARRVALRWSPASQLPRGGTGAPTAGPDLRHQRGGTPPRRTTPAPTTSTPSTPQHDRAHGHRQGAAERTACGAAVRRGRAQLGVGHRGGKKQYEGVLADGRRKAFTDTKQVKIVIGNAGAVQLTVNGVDLGPPGGNGRWCALTFGPGDPTAPG